MNILQPAINDKQLNPRTYIPCGLYTSTNVFLRDDDDHVIKISYYF